MTTVGATTTNNVTIIKKNILFVPWKRSLTVILATLLSVSHSPLFLTM
jgi:hypothetical protein